MLAGQATGSWAWQSRYLGLGTLGLGNLVKQLKKGGAPEYGEVKMHTGHETIFLTVPRNKFIYALES